MLITPDDEAFLQQFEALTLTGTAFKHRGHLRIAWLYLTRYPYPQASARISEGISRYAASIGAAHVYDAALTQQWIARIHSTLQSPANSISFEAWIAAHPELLIK